MASQESEPIDRSKLKTPEQVSGWHGAGEGEPQQDYADIAKDSETNPEADPERATTVGAPRAAGTAESGWDTSGPPDAVR